MNSEFKSQLAKLNNILNSISSDINSNDFESAIAALEELEDKACELRNKLIANER